MEETYATSKLMDGKIKLQEIMAEKEMEHRTGCLKRRN